MREPVANREISRESVVSREPVEDREGVDTSVEGGASSTLPNGGAFAFVMTARFPGWAHARPEGGAYES